MAQLAWTADLNTGIDVIDRQHRRIVDYINQLDTARKAGDARGVGEVLENLVDYTLSHFAFEESLMEDAGYTFTRAHRKVHELFTRRIESLRSRFRNGEDVGEELDSLLGRWLFNHIRSDDASYVQSVRTSMLRLTEPANGGWLERTLARFFA